jgi:GGDEF domain-containing protein
MGARWGGEEFVLILPDSGASQALEVVDRLRAKLAENLLAGSIPAFTASFGISDRTLQSCVAETAGEGQRSSGR